MTKQKLNQNLFETTFFEDIREAYASIIEDHHFSIVEKPPYSVELKSEVCRIAIYRDWKDNSIRSDIKPARTEQVPKVQYYNTVDVGYLIKFLNPEVKFEYGHCPTPERLREEINRLATATRQYCAPMLEGEFTKWIELRKIIMKKVGIPL